MDLRLLHYFIAVSEDLSITGAAKRLNMGQPSLSYQIRQLESVVGTSLFSRDRHHLQLTEAGRVFLDEARGLLQHFDHAVNLAKQAARAEAGQIMIGFMPGAEGRIFARVLPILLRNYPEIQIVLRTLSSPEQETALHNREINIGLLRGPILDESIATEVFLREKLLAVLPAGHELAQLERVPVPRLAELPLIHTSRVITPAPYDAVHATAARAGVNFKTLFETENLMTTLNAIASGLGFSLMPEYVQEILPKSVVARPLDLTPEPELELLVAYRKDDRLPALAFFLSLLRDYREKPMDYTAGVNTEAGNGRKNLPGQHKKRTKSSRR